ncbi:hypothetical protein QA601_18025 [Chitinispirillales bacterium ANBcel5]|uniref:hypothetical protein n=1 Tax=Cellulosispirillum alkaliphilum TaxID=3039283 RepID=UPI002A4F1B90|nr:hypothetical protein [Chitinispirillales bacterium ANBcel5]
MRKRIKRVCRTIPHDHSTMEQTPGTIPHDHSTMEQTPGTILHDHSTLEQTYFLYKTSPRGVDVFLPKHPDKISHSLLHPSIIRHLRV